MLTSAHLIKLNYTPDLTQAGIAYACRSLPHTYDRMGGSLLDRMRRIVIGKAVELAFRRYLAAQNVPYDNLGATPFTDPDRYDIALGGRRCDIKSFHFFQKEGIRRLRRDPGLLLQASALVPTDQVASTHLDDEDLYIFAFATALVTKDQADLEKALAAGQPIYLIHPFPKGWARPFGWASFGSLSITSDSQRELSLEIGGQGQDRAFQTERAILQPGRQTLITRDFFSLAYLHLDRQLSGTLRVHSAASKKAHVVTSEGYGNIWVYGLEIYLAGYITRGEFRRRAHLLPAGSRVFQYAHTRTANLALLIQELHPLADLLNRSIAWADQPPRS